MLQAADRDISTFIVVLDGASDHQIERIRRNEDITRKGTVVERVSGVLRLGHRFTIHGRGEVRFRIHGREHAPRLLLLLDLVGFHSPLFGDSVKELDQHEGLRSVLA